MIIDWAVNGTSQAAYTWSGNIPVGSSETFVIGTAVFPFGLNNITASIIEVNGYPDFDLTNNDQELDIDAQLSGAYTIGVSGADFTSFVEAVSALQAYGICGAVEFLIDDGVYTEQVAIPFIQGVDASSTITFRSASQNPKDVVLVNNNVGYAPNYTLLLAGAQYIKFQDITLKKTGTSLYGTILRMENGASNNSFTNCIFDGLITTTVSQDLDIVQISGQYNNDNSFFNNAFNHGNLALAVNLDGLLSSGIRIEGNTFDQQYAGGILINNHFNAYVSGNVLESDPSNTYTGVLSQGGIGIQILKNNIHTQKGGGIKVIDLLSSLFGGPSLVANNMVIAGTDDSAFGLLVDNVNNLQVYYNSIAVLSNSIFTSNSALKVDDNSANLLVKNNILVFVGPNGYAYEVTSPATGGITDSDYNDLYAPGSRYIGSWGGNLARTIYRMAIGQRNGRPIFKCRSFICFCH